MFRRLKMVLAWPLYSANSVSTYAMLVFPLALHQRYFFLPARHPCWQLEEVHPKFLQ